MKARNFLLSLLTCLSLFGTIIRADDQKEPSELLLSEFAEDISSDDVRGYLPVPTSVSQTTNAFTNIISPAFLGNTTTTFCNCGEYVLSRGIDYTTSSTNGCPMIRITGGGVDFDLSHNCACFNRAATCSSAAPGSHNVGIEVGYSPNLIGSNTQPTSVVIENGIMCNWDIAILIHAGVRNVTIRNMVFTDNVIPIVCLANDGGSYNSDAQADQIGTTITNAISSGQDISTITLENVVILGSMYGAGYAGVGQLDCLHWIRSYLTDGTAKDTGPAASTTVGTNSCHYSTHAVMPKADSPYNDYLATNVTVDPAPGKPAYVYTGMYFYGVSNLKLNNVEISDVGFDGQLSGPVPENTVAYGMWFRNCHSIFMQDVSATKCRSGQSVVGAYFDSCDVVSVERAQLSDNYVTFIVAPLTDATAPVNAIEQYWAAGVVLRDSNLVNMSDVVVSRTQGYHNAWGIRTILVNNTSSNALNFTNIWADNLVANYATASNASYASGNVYGFDFGDLFRKTSLSDPSRKAALGVQKLQMKNISVSYCTANNEFKGIYLGDGSVALDLDEIYIDANAINSSSIGQNSGIDFGAATVNFLQNPTGTPIADYVTPSVASLKGLNLSNVSMMGNTGPNYSANNHNFNGIRGITNLAPMILSNNYFRDITITNATIRNTQTMGIGFSVQGIVGTISDLFDYGVVQRLTLDTVDFDTNYYSVAVGYLNNSAFKNSTFSGNNGSGIAIQAGATDFAMDSCQVDYNAQLVAGDGLHVEGNGIDTFGNLDGANIVNSTFDYNGTASFPADGIYVFGSFSDSIVNDCEFVGNYIQSGSAGNGIEAVRGAERLNFLNSYFAQGSNQVRGIYLGSNPTAAEFIKVDNCIFEGLSRGGIIVGIANDNSTHVSFASDNIEITNSLFTANGSAGSPFYPTIGIYSSSSVAPIANVTLDKCQVLSSGSVGLNIDALSIQTLLVKNSVFTNNVLQGILLGSTVTTGAQQFTDIAIENCTIDSNDDTGFEITGNDTGVMIQDVVLKDTSFNYNNGRGLLWGTLASSINSITAADIMIQGCTFDSNGVQDTSAAGFEITAHTGNTINVYSIDMNQSSFSKNGNQGILLGHESTDTGTTTVTDFSMQDSVVDGNGQNGLEISSSSSTQVKSAMFAGTSFNQNNGKGILLGNASGTLTSVSDWFMDDCSVNSNQDYGFQVTAASLIDSTVQSILLKNTTFNNNGTIGFYAAIVNGLYMEGCKASENYSGSAVDVYGMLVATGGSSIIIKDSEFNYNLSIDSTGGNATGLNIYNGFSISLENVYANQNSTITANKTAWGIYLQNHTNDLSLINVEANANISNNADSTTTVNNAYGIQVDDAIGVFADGLRANNNVGSPNSYNSTSHVGSQAIGLWFNFNTDGTVGCSFNNVEASGNSSGFVAYGLRMDSPSGVDINGLEVLANASMFATIGALSFYQAAGAYFNGGSSVHVTNLHADANNEAQTNANSLAIDSADAGSSEHAVNVTNQIAHHFPVQNQSGAYGVFIDGTQDLTIDCGSASRNVGVRAAGIFARNADNLNIKNIDASENHGTGGVWWSGDASAGDIFNGMNNTSMAIPVEIAQQACLFGYGSGSVNLTLAYQDLLLNLEQVNAPSAAISDDCSSMGLTTFASQQVAMLYRLIWSTIAKFRRFSTGLGIGLYNCNFATINSCRALGNLSDKDSAGGIAIYGGKSSSTFYDNCGLMGQCDCGAEGSSVLNCTVGNNKAWDFSTRGGSGTYAINGSIDITEWLPLYTFLGTTAYTSGASSPYTTTTDLIALIGAATWDSCSDTGDINEIVNGTHSTPTATQTKTETLNSYTALCSTASNSVTYSWTLNNRKLSVGFNDHSPDFTSSNELYDFVSPVPLGVGILLECQRDCFVNDNNCYGNKGNAGLGVGILADGAISSMFMGNKATNNAADALGQAWGLADFEITTPNVWYSNWMYANRIDTYLNSSYLIPFDPALAAGQSLPVVAVYQGNIDTLANMSSLSNVIVYFNNPRQISACVNEEMAQLWLDDDYIAA